MLFLHGHQIEVLGLFDLFVQDLLSWPAICTVGFVVFEKRAHALAGLPAAKPVLAGVVALVPGQTSVVRFELVSERRHQISGHLH